MNIDELNDKLGKNFQVNYDKQIHVTRKKFLGL